MDFFIVLPCTILKVSDVRDGSSGVWRGKREALGRFNSDSVQITGERTVAGGEGHAPEQPLIKKPIPDGVLENK
jgi:hypothetical protein